MKGKRSGVSQGGTIAFRRAYGDLAILRSFLKEETPFAALTGTADADTCSVIISTLCLKDPLMVHVSPNRNNLRFAIVSTKKDAMFAELDWLVLHIKEKGELSDKTIVFCNTINDIACVVNYLMMKLEKHAYSPKELCEPPNCLIGIYHSSSWPHCKNRIVQSFRGEGKVRVVVASSALSMGVNFPDIRYIVNWGPARSLLDQHQEAGRAGRDGLPSHVLIIYHGQQLSHCEEDIKAMVKANGCLRVAAYKPIDECIQPQEPGHSCCSYCSSRCSCGQCELSKPLFETFKQGEVGATRDFLLTRPVSNQEKLDLRDSLMEVKDSLIKSNSVFDDISCHGFSDQLVEDVVANCHRLFTVNDILELCPIFSIVHALKVLELIQELFLDIPNFDEFLDIMRFEECSTSDDLSHLLRDVTLLGDSPESTDGEDEEVVEVF